MEIKKIHFWSAFKFFLIFGVVIGLLLGILVSLYLNSAANNISSQLSNPDIQAFLDQSGGDYTQMAEYLKSSAKIAWIVTTLLTTLFSAIAGLITILLYNVIAKSSSGIVVDIEDKKKW